MKKLLANPTAELALRSLTNTKNRVADGLRNTLDLSASVGQASLDKASIWGEKTQVVLGRFIARRIAAVTTEPDRVDIVAWLGVVREVVGNADLSEAQKTKFIYDICDLKETGGIAVRSFVEAAKSIKDSDFPLALKVAIPASLAASTVIAGKGVGIAGFGTAIGLPALLLVFLGVAGITSTIEGLLGGGSAPSYLALIASLIAKDDVLRCSRKEMRDAMSIDPIEPKRFTENNTSADLLFDSLYAMQPTEFERHVMSYFNSAGYFSWVTGASNDFGVDGFAKHPNGLIVVQCKRYARDNAIGRPLVQQFKGVVEEQNAWKGFVVCTSRFTSEARESAALNDKVALVDLEGLFAWSQGDFSLA